jgi:hypothetical protein
LVRYSFCSLGEDTLQKLTGLPYKKRDWGFNSFFH